MSRVVIASQNQHKIAEMNEILREFKMKAVSLREVGLEDLDIEEDGSTFEENSLKKAMEVVRLTSQIAIADDSGLEVMAIDKEPGVYSARYAGDKASDEENNEKLLLNMMNLKGEERRARFVSVITMAFPNGNKIVARGEVYGHISTQKMGEGGFGYDPYFIPDGYSKSFGQFSMEEKNRISHRAEALKKLRILIENEKGEDLV